MSGFRAYRANPGRPVSAPADVATTASSRYRICATKTKTNRRDTETAWSSRLSSLAPDVDPPELAGLDADGVASFDRDRPVRCGADSASRADRTACPRWQA